MAGELPSHKIKIGFIGGTGLEDPKILTNFVEHDLTTPFGKPSSPLVEGEINGTPVVLLARHGRHHEFSPTNVNYRANFWAMKMLGVNIIMGSNASGSLRENIIPGEFVFFDSFIDRTTKREQTFHDGQPGHPCKGVCHVPMLPAFNETLRKILIESANDLKLPHHDKGNIICIEGPRYSSLAESNLFRQWGAHVINMTICPEVALARELGIPYAGVALVTDFDCWKEGDRHVSVDVVTELIISNAEKTKRLFVHAIEKIGAATTELLDEVRAAKLVARNSVMIDPAEVLEHLL